MTTKTATVSELPVSNRKVCKFQFERETSGAVRFQEIDAKGEVVELAFATIGTLYLRKTALGRGVVPKAVTVTVEID